MIDQRLKQLREDIDAVAKRAGRQPTDVRLIAVSKTRALTEVEQVVSVGQIDFGENTVQDAMRKIPHVSQGNVQWHFIGHLQSKKAKSIPGHFQWVHTVDSDKLAQKLAQAMQLSQVTTPLNCLLQVNVSAEASKSGVVFDEVKPMLERLLTADCPLLQWRGLMCMGVRGDADATRSVFVQLQQLQQEIQQQFALPHFDQLSMGMSGDYTIAIEQGATLIRLGTAIFGERDYT